MSNEVVVLKGVQRYFDNGQVKALDGIDLVVSSGESLAILGTSGSGKSTLLHIIGTLDFPTAGEVFICGTSSSRAANLDRIRNEKLGFVFQLHNLIPSLTLWENVALPLYPRESSARTRKERARAALADVGLLHRADFRPIHISGGERQRAATARALVNDPAIILADEPTGNLDLETGLKLCDLLLEKCADTGKTVLIVTHNLEIARRAKRVVTLRAGKLMPCGSD